MPWADGFLRPIGFDLVTSPWRKRDGQSVLATRACTATKTPRLNFTSRRAAAFVAVADWTVLSSWQLRHRYGGAGARTSNRYASYGAGPGLVPCRRCVFGRF